MRPKSLFQSYWQRPLHQRLWQGAFALGALLLSFILVNAFTPADKSVNTHMLGLDFLAFYSGGSFLRSGRLAELYDLSAIRSFQHALAAAAHVDLGAKFGPFWNPPFYAWVFVPLAALPYRTALAVWECLGLGALAGALVLLVGMLRRRGVSLAERPLGWRYWGLIPALILVCMPLVRAMGHGQNTPSSLLLLCLTVWAWRSGRALAAGILGALLFYKPQLAAVIAVVMVLNLGRRCLLGLALTGGTLLLVNVLSLPGSLADYLHRLPLNMHYFQAEIPYSWERQTTFLGFWRLLLQGYATGEASLAVRWLSGVCCALLGGALLVAAVRFRRCTGWRRDRLIAATISAMPLLMPYYLDYDLLLLAVPAVLVAGEMLANDGGVNPARADRWLIRIWGLLFVWMIFNPAIAGITHLNLAVVLSSGVAVLLVRRALHGAEFLLRLKSFIPSYWHRPLQMRLWQGAFALGAFIITFVVVNAFLPADKAVNTDMLGHDFLAFYSGGSFLRSGRLAELYYLPSIRTFEHATAAAAHLKVGDSFGPFWNPPFYALVFVPLAALPYRTALAVWECLGLAALAGALVLLVGMLRRRDALPAERPLGWRYWGLVPALVLVCTPFIQAMTHGQNTPSSLLLLCLTVWAWRGGRALAAGILGGLLFYKPQLAAVIAVVMVLNLGRRCLLGLALTGGTLLLVNVLSLPGSLADYLHRLPLNVHYMQVESPYLWERHPTFIAFWHLLLQGRAAGEASLAVRLLSGICCTLLGGALLAAALRFRCCTGWRRDRLIAATICAMPLLMPFYFDYDLLLLAVPAVLVAGEILANGGGVNLARADRWLIRIWGLLYVWMFVNPGMGNLTHVNLVVVLSSGVAGLLVGRAWRGENAHTVLQAAPDVRLAA